MSNLNNDLTPTLPVAINGQLQLQDNAIADFSLDLPVMHDQHNQEEETYLAPIQMLDLDSYLCTERQQLKCKAPEALVTLSNDDEEGGLKI